MDSFEHALPAGTIIDERYRIDSVLGEGGFAITYKAFDTKLQCDVAIKEFLPIELAARSSDTRTVQARTNRNDDYSFGLNKFLEEARTLAQLQHPHIVQVTNFIEAHGTGYLVMTYAEGQELGAWLKTQPGQLSEEAVLGIITPILEGVTKVHQQGLLHRDIKPGNIFLRNEGGPMLIDFGAARQAIGEKSKSISAIISQGYAPPEQYTSRGKQGPYTDLYALGATLYYLITGQQPVESVDRSHDIHEGEPDPMTPAIELGKGKVSDWLLQLTDQLLNISPKQRPQSAEVVLQAINNKTMALIETAGAASSTSAGNNKTRVIKDGERFASAAAGQPSVATKSKTSLYAGIAAAVVFAIGAGVYVGQQPNDAVSENAKIQSVATQESNKTLAKGKAILFVESTPSGAEVYLDKHLLGKTPYQADNLPKGIFELTLKHDMSSDLTESLQLTDNLVVKKSLTLKAATGNYSVFSTPVGAAIAIDGKDTGKQTPSSLTGVAAGEHTLTLSKDTYYPKKQSIYIRKGETLRGDFTLEGGHLVQYKGKWVEPEEKTRLVAEAKVLAEKRKAEQEKQRLEKLARAKAEAERKAREESEKLARAKAEAERKAREESEKQARIKAEQERKAHEAEANRQAELAKIKAKQERKAQAAGPSLLLDGYAYSGAATGSNFNPPARQGNHSSVSFKAPDIAENGAVVPVTINNLNLLPGEWVTIKANGCDVMRMRNAGSSAVDSLSTRIRLPKTSNVGISFNSGSVTASKQVKVTIGGGNDGCSTNLADASSLLNNVSSSSSKIKLRASNKSSGVNLKALTMHAMSSSKYIKGFLVSSGSEKVYIDTNAGVSQNPYLGIQFTGGGSDASVTWVDSQGSGETQSSSVR